MNRIAIPDGSATEEWFSLAFPEPPLLGSLWSFDLNETWAEIGGYEGLSANLRIAKVKIPNEELAHDHFGVLLDIDVFNLLVKNAPEFEETPDWLQRAHAAENEIFESCITEQLRQKFGLKEGTS